MDRAIYEMRLPNNVSIQYNARRERWLYLIKERIEVVGKGEGVGAGRFLDRQDDCRIATF